MKKFRSLKKATKWLRKRINTLAGRFLYDLIVNILANLIVGILLSWLVR